MFSKKNIKNIPLEETLHAAGSRKMLVGKNDTTSVYFEAFANSFMPLGEKFAMHKHENMIEICLVIKGKGVIRNSTGEEETFKTGDRFIFPANTEHEIENTSEDQAEFYFIRVQNK